MNMIKYVVFSLLLLGIPVIGQGQDVKISMMHIKQNNLLILNLTNNTDKEVVIMNQAEVVLQLYKILMESDLKYCSLYLIRKRAKEYQLKL